MANIFSIRKSLDLCENHGVSKVALAQDLTLYRSTFCFDSHNKTLFASVQKIQRQSQHPLTLKLNNWLPSTHNRWLPNTEQMGKIRTFLYKTQSDWLKISFLMMGCQKISSTKVEEKNKASISINNNSEKNY